MGKFTDIQLFGCTQNPGLHSLGLSQVISSQQGIAEFVQSLPSQIPDSQDLPSSPLVESLWTVFQECAETPNLSVLFYSDLEENTKTLSLMRAENRDLLTNPTHLAKIIDQISNDFGRCPQLSHLNQIEILAMPGSKEVTFQQLQPFWLGVLAKNQIPPEKVKFQFAFNSKEETLSLGNQPHNRPH
ncbi:MAG: hypothetical protein K1Y36_25775 [Blastocatellia bacterium]|nr:hypothetical protein [Blastocatellia bacterium]